MTHVAREPFPVSRYVLAACVIRLLGLSVSGGESPVLSIWSRTIFVAVQANAASPTRKSRTKAATAVAAPWADGAARGALRRDGAATALARRLHLRDDQQRCHPSAHGLLVGGAGYGSVARRARRLAHRGEPPTPAPARLHAAVLTIVDRRIFARCTCN